MCYPPKESESVAIVSLSEVSQSWDILSAVELAVTLSWEKENKTKYLEIKILFIHLKTQGT